MKSLQERRQAITGGVGRLGYAGHAHEQRRVQRDCTTVPRSLRVTAPRDWWVYVVVTPQGQFYCGISTDVRERVRKHNRGQGAKYLCGARLPVRLLMSWHFPGASARSNALKAEAWFKRQSKKRKVQIITLNAEMEPKGWTFAAREALCASSARNSWKGSPR